MAARFAFCILLVGLTTAGSTVDAAITHTWLTHQTNDPSNIVVSWVSSQAGDSTVEFGLTDQYGATVHVNENTTLHHVEIPLTAHDATYHYRVKTGSQYPEEKAK